MSARASPSRSVRARRFNRGRATISDGLWTLDAQHVVRGIRNGEFSSREVVTSCLERIDALNQGLNALTEIRADAALAAADAADREVARGAALGPLHGIPVTIKGNVDVAGWATVNGCRALASNVADRTSPCVQNWLDAGAILVGRTNTPEFSCRWETDNEVFGATRNPWNADLTPGGSSGGAAASIATGMTPLAHGNDLGGSLRQPAQACGVASLRPSLGRIPTWVPSAPEPSMGVQLMNVEGPMARRVADVRLGLQAMARCRWQDPGCVPVPLGEPEADRLPIAVAVDPMGLGVHEQVADGVTRAASILGDAGYRTDPAEPAAMADALQVWKTICLGELINGLAPAVREICSPALLKTFEHYAAAVPDLTPESYMQAFANRRTALRQWLEFFQRYSVLVAPVSTQPPQARNHDIATPETTARVMESMRTLCMINALGLPSAVVPVGVRDGLPQAVQVIGPPFMEMRCLAVAEVIEAGVAAFLPIDPK